MQHVQLTGVLELLKGRWICCRLNARCSSLSQRMGLGPDSVTAMVNCIKGIEDAAKYHRIG